MFKWFYQLDRILRGEATRPEALKDGEVKIPIWGITFVLTILGIFYGLCMGSFALMRGFENDAIQATYMQAIASMCKVPLLFLLTLLITFPSLYVFNALVGSRLGMASLLKLLIASLGVNMTLLASLGPIVVFFTLSTPNYSFIVGLNVVVYTIAGLFGLGFLLQTLNRLTQLPELESTLPSPESTSRVSQETIAETSAESADPVVVVDPMDHSLPPVVQEPGLTSEPGPLEPSERGIGRNVRVVFVSWMIMFGLVGSQMGWVLRPFIGSPNREFQWFRGRESNFFDAVYRLLDVFG